MGLERKPLHQGDRFGMLTVVAKDEERTQVRKKQYYFCQCDCGSPIKSILKSIETDVDDVVGKVEEISSSKMYRTEIVVNGVSIFRDKSQQSVMSCRVYSWDKDITDTHRSLPPVK